MSTVKLAQYLFTRLRQIGIESIHGVPGDYNLNLLDFVEPAGLTWVGNTNELNAAYASDGYARIKGIAGLVTTFGVGELSAINGIAGAYTERAAIVHIVGTPNRAAQASGSRLHHTLNDGDYRHFAKMAAHVTVAQARLDDPQTSAAQIDAILLQCITHSRPVYLEVPADMVNAEMETKALNASIHRVKPRRTTEHEKPILELLGRIYSAKQPIILVDGEIRAMGIVDDVQEIVRRTKWPTWTSTFAKSLMDETLPNVQGVWEGDYATPAITEFILKADLVLCFGPHFSSTNTYRFSSIPNEDVTIKIMDESLEMGRDARFSLPGQIAVDVLLHEMDMAQTRRYETPPALPSQSPVRFSDLAADANISQDSFWRVMSSFLRPGDIVFGETGTSGYGCREMSLPATTRLFTPVTWLSIGYMLPAAQGAALAQKELIASSRYHGLEAGRTILFIGDGSFQMTAQEMATMVRHDLNVTIFLINNDGYTIERVIHGLKQQYNDISFWRYLHAPALFGARPDTYTASARTWRELETILNEEEVKDGGHLRMVELVMDREDVPRGMLAGLLASQQQAEAERK